MTKLAISQPAGGLVQISFGTATFYFRTVPIIRNALGLEVGVRASFSNLYRFVSANDLVIDRYPAIASILSLQSALASLSMPELIITDQGDMTIQ